MRFDEYVQHDATGLAALVRTGQVTAHELLDVALERVAATDEAIAAVVHLQEGVARKAIDAGLPDGPFTGVPFLLKDLGCEAVDFPGSMGSRLFRDYRYGFDSEIFLRFRAAGLNTFGRTTAPEGGVGPTTEAQVYGRVTRNPWNTGHVCGGSSGGSGAAVSAGVVPVAHGGDGGGSVRIPASNCGLFGLKPTRALLPDGPASGEGWAGMAIDGMFSRSVRDHAAFLDACAGPDVGTPYYAPRYRPSGHASFVGAIAAPPRRLRIAMSTRSTTGAAIHPDCVAAVEHTARLLESLGHEVVPAEPQVPIEQFMRQWSLIVACGTQLMVDSRLEQLGRIDAGDDIEGVTRLACEMAAGVSGAQYLAAVDFVHSVGRTMGRFLQGYDMLLTATMAEPPALIGRFNPRRTDAWQSFIDYRLEHVLPYSPFTPLANGTGQPAMSLPLFVNEAGLPVGTHILGRAGDDDVLLQLAAQLELADPWFHRRPPL